MSAENTVETPLTAKHRAAGAPLAEFDGCALPEVFSDFDEEYRAGRETVALFDTSWHVTLAIRGRDRVRYLHAISSNNIQTLENGHGIFALLLNPQGRILAELEVYARPEELLVLSHASLGARTVATLEKYVIGSQVQIEDLSDRLGSVAVEGPLAAVVVQEACGVALDDLAEMTTQDAAVEGVPCTLIRRSHFGEVGAEFLAGSQALPGLWSALAARVSAQRGQPIGMAALNALRLDANIPWFPADFNDAMIPHEAALENTHISFHKGCYTGQEIVERVRTRGHVNRKRVSLKFSTALPPSPGTKLRSGGTEIGTVTSAAFSPKGGTAIGIGYVRKEYFPPGSVVEFNGGTAEVRPI
jgi:folate-binding protein YgfZ